MQPSQIAAIAKALRQSSGLRNQRDPLDWDAIAKRLAMAPGGFESALILAAKFRDYNNAKS